MAESYFKDPLLAKWEKTWLCKDTRRIVEHTFDRGGTNTLGVYRWLSANHAKRLAADVGALFSAICAELSAAREMREVLREVEWSGFSQYSSGRWVDPVSGRVFDDPPQNLRACPRCYGLQPEQPFLPPPGIFRIGHAPDCRLARLIGGDRG